MAEERGFIESDPAFMVNLSTIVFYALLFAAALGIASLTDNSCSVHDAARSDNSGFDETYGL
jgi:hypothetical protein